MENKIETEIKNASELLFISKSKEKPFDVIIQDLIMTANCGDRAFYAYYFISNENIGKLIDFGCKISKTTNMDGRNITVISFDNQ